MSASESSYPMLAKHLLLTGGLVAAAALKAGKDAAWYASRKLNEPKCARPRAARAR